MRDIITKAEQERKRKRNQIIVGLILVAVMIFSTLGYAFMGEEKQNTDNSNKVNYNGFTFENQNGLWFLTIGASQFSFKYNPEEVEKADSELKTLDNYIEKPLYIFSENKEAEYEIYRNLDQIVLRRQYACLDNNCSENFPVKNCTDNFIIIEKSDFNEIKQDQNCVFIRGHDENLTGMTDAALFKMIGVE